MRLDGDTPRPEADRDLDVRVGRSERADDLRTQRVTSDARSAVTSDVSSAVTISARRAR